MGARLTLRATALAGLQVAETARLQDERGSFARLYCESELAAAIGDRRIVQINDSITRDTGTVRGMHFQHRPHAEMKLVRCLRGRAWDVAVDLRAGSATFLRWHAEELSAENGRMMVIPEGFAHGFQALAPETELLYLHTHAYVPQAEAGVRWDDARIAIAWPLPPTQVSERDCAWPELDTGFAGLAP
jgi:dTDP-4-dehydrorhamnose 3,5-epimerase